MPQRPAFFARKSAGEPQVVSWGFFVVNRLFGSVRQRNFVRGKLRFGFRNAALTALLLSFFGTGSAHAQSPTANPDATPSVREVVDEAGRLVRIPRLAQRIVSLAPSLTETLYALGLQARLVGDTDFCDYPEDAQKKAKVGGAINPNFEEIAALQPDLVLVIKSLNRYDTVRALDGLGIPAYATDPHTVDEIISSTQRLAEILGAPEAGNALAADMEHRLSGLKERLAPLPPRKVLFVVWAEPLISIGKDTFISDALRRAGAVSIVDSSQSWPQVNLEEVVKLQPEYLVFATGHGENIEHDIDAFSNLPGWRLLEAVRNKKLAMISDAVNRPAPRIVSAIEDLARQLHPEAFVETPEKEKIRKESPPANERPTAHSTSGAESREASSEEARACAR
jgi:iron complex transport system substrate-binding protein